ncbi:TIGR01777 family protein [Aquibacillus halophilus]|uniref:TIGR01777 family protein n=1 Tax=Aquibacillus halophilus TaxID=930132 RepID=A0A6A8DG84_9BACI|nr:TIGR01777 family oxidoreductase [Aquibacillus halophilus]MRH44654.1 TIGR01777 family protein [Aquibacillus halophilus]
MKIAITGGTGFVGKQLTDELVKQKHDVYILTRSPERHQDTSQVRYVGWLKEEYHPEQELPQLDAIVNLAGDSLFGYWTKTKKDRILSSRIKATENVVDLIKQMEKKPQVLVNASAIGYYGTSTTDSFTENTTASGDDFLAHVTKKWEQTAKAAESYGVRTVYARFGIILGSEGALPMMTMPFKLMVGGKVGTGQQWMSWIHISDVVGLILFAINNNQIEGALNAVAPNPVRNKEFSQMIAKVMHRPYWLPAPSFAMKTVLGDMSMLVLKGQHVIPEKATLQHYSFNYPTLEDALENIL